MGCGHVQLPLLCAANRLVKNGHTVTAINSSTHLYYPGMSPGYIGNSYQEHEMRIDVAKLADECGVRFLSTMARHIDIQKKQITTDRAVIPYDVASINIGSTSTLSAFEHIEEHALYSSIFPTKPTKEFLSVKSALHECFLRAHQTGKKKTISIVGGGAAAVEIASNIRVQYDTFCASHKQASSATAHTRNTTNPTRLIEICIFNDGRILSQHSHLLRYHTTHMLHKRGIIIKQARVIRLYAKKLQTAEGNNSKAYHKTSLTIIATGITPPPLLRSSGFSVHVDGAMRVNRYLQSIDSKSVFGGGDCIHYIPRPLPKIGVYAVRQGIVIRDNIFTYASKQPSAPHHPKTQLKPFRPQRNFFFALNMGLRYGIATKYHITWTGKGAFWLKNNFDQKFIDYYRNEKRQCCS